MLSFLGCNRRNNDAPTLNILEHPQIVEATLPINEDEIVMNTISESEFIPQILEQSVSALVALHHLDFFYDEFSSENDSISIFLFNLAMNFYGERMDNQLISFSKDEIDYLLNLTFGSRFSAGDINVNDVDEHMARPLYNDGVFSFRIGEPIFASLVFLSAPDEHTYVYEYRVRNNAYELDESGKVTVTVETSFGNSYGFSIKALQIMDYKIND